MKNMFSLFLWVICLVFSGCEDSTQNNYSITDADNDVVYTSFSSTSDLEGIWVRVDQEDYGTYSYEVRGDKLIYREHTGYIDKGNYFVCNTFDNIRITVKYEFDKEEQAIYVAGIKAGVFTRKGKNKASYKDCSGILRDCDLQRVKGIKIDGESDLDSGTSTPSTGDGVLSGKFSVSASQKVHFSQGNLQYKASTNTWRFAAEQYHCVGSNNANISPSYNGWIDLFGWGTGNNPTLLSTSESDYSTFVEGH